MQTDYTVCPLLKRSATKVSAIGIMGNILLSILKAVAGIISGSGALISDAVHSAADVFSNIVVIIGIRLSAKKPDKEHPYGHERFECIAAAILAIILLITGIFIGKNALMQIIGKNLSSDASPDFFAVLAAGVSILIKDFLFRFTKVYALKYNSQALLADALHHRSDVFATLGALVGILGARMGYPILDSVASVAICLLILKTAYGILKEAAVNMIDRSCDTATVKQIRDIIKGVDGVADISSLRTRLFGNKIYAEAEIFVSSALTVEGVAYLYATIKNEVIKALPQIKEISVIPLPQK